MNLDDLIKSFEKVEDKSDDTVGSEPIMFVHDSCVRQRGKLYSFKDDEYEVLKALLNKTKIPDNSYQFVAAVNQVGVTDDSATTAIVQSNRGRMESLIAQANPKLIFLLGNLPLRTVLRKSGISNKRGKEFWIDIDGQRYPVVPVYHPFSLYSEPKLRELFIQDIDNAYDKFVLNKNKFSGSSYVLCNTMELAEKHLSSLQSADVISVDIETTGLDFKKDKITTIGIATGEKQAFVIPMYHRESPFSTKEVQKIIQMLDDTMRSDSVAKVFHNFKFDMKFLSNCGITGFNNIHDTQIIHSLLDENKPHALMDIVKEYWPNELEEF